MPCSSASASNTTNELRLPPGRRGGTQQSHRKAIECYETREPGLGLGFATQVHAAVQRALAFPFAWQEMGSDIRRALVHRFPYGVLYVAEPDHLLIVAVMRLHRNPDYWRNRTS